MTEVLLGPRAYANLLREEQGKYRYRVMPAASGGVGVFFPDGMAYGAAPITDETRAEAEEVRREAEEAFMRAGHVLEQEAAKEAARHAPWRERLREWLGRAWL